MRKCSTQVACKLELSLVVLSASCSGSDRKPRNRPNQEFMTLPSECVSLNRLVLGDFYSSPS